MGGGKKETYKEDTDIVGKGKGISQCPHNQVWCHLVAIWVPSSRWDFLGSAWRAPELGTTQPFRK